MTTRTTTTTRTGTIIRPSDDDVGGDDFDSAGRLRSRHLVCKAKFFLLRPYLWYFFFRLQFFCEGKLNTIQMVSFLSFLQSVFFPPFSHLFFHHFFVSFSESMLDGGIKVFLVSMNPFFLLADKPKLLNKSTPDDSKGVIFFRCPFLFIFFFFTMMVNEWTRGLPSILTFLNGFGDKLRTVSRDE